MSDVATPTPGSGAGPLQHHEPSLVDAFLDVRVVTTSALDADRRRNAINLRLLYAELAKLAEPIFRQFRLASDVRDGAVNVIAHRFATKGPRRENTGTPDTDGRVRAYFRTALQNEARSACRTRTAQRSREESLDTSGTVNGRTQHERLADERLSVEERLEAAQEHVVLKRANAAVVAWFIAQRDALCADKESRRQGTGERLKETLDELARAARGDLDVNALAAASLPENADSSAVKRARNKIDARYTRARRALYDWLETRLQIDGAPDADAVWVWFDRETQLQPLPS